MAKKSDIESDITLELDGTVTPGQLIEAISAFSGLLNGGQKNIDASVNPQWTIQVKKGSNLIGYYSHTASPALISNLENGLRKLEAGAEMPTGFDEMMLRNICRLQAIEKNTKARKTNVKIWLDREPTPLHPRMKDHIDKVLKGAFEEYGAVEGVLKILDSHNDHQFAIVEPLYFKKILCFPAADGSVFAEAYKLFGQKVEAEGMVKYTSHGIPYEILVDKIYQLPVVKDANAYVLTQGILKPYV